MIRNGKGLRNLSNPIYLLMRSEKDKRPAQSHYQLVAKLGFEPRSLASQFNVILPTEIPKKIRPNSKEGPKNCIL